MAKHQRQTDIVNDLAEELVEEVELEELEDIVDFNAQVTDLHSKELKKHRKLIKKLIKAMKVQEEDLDTAYEEIQALKVVVARQDPFKIYANAPQQDTNMKFMAGTIKDIADSAVAFSRSLFEPQPKINDEG